MVATFLTSLMAVIYKEFHWGMMSKISKKGKSNIKGGLDPCVQMLKSLIIDGRLHSQSSKSNCAVDFTLRNKLLMISFSSTPTPTPLFDPYPRLVLHQQIISTLRHRKINYAKKLFHSKFPAIA